MVKKHINLPASDRLAATSTAGTFHTRRASNTSQPSLIVNNPSTKASSGANPNFASKQPSMKNMQVTAKEIQYASKGDGRRMIKRVITENLKRSKSKQAQIDA